MDVSPPYPLCFFIPTNKKVRGTTFKCILSISDTSLRAAGARLAQQNLLTVATQLAHVVLQPKERHFDNIILYCRFSLLIKMLFFNTQDSLHCS